MLEATHFAVNQDIQSTTSNMLVRWSPGRLVFAAADGRRMSIEERALPGIDTTGETMLPLRAVAELRKLLDTDCKVQFVATESQTFLDFGEFEFTCRRAEATFPPYETFPAHRIEQPMKLPVAAAIDSLSAVNLAAGRGDVTANLLFSYADGETVFSAESPDKGIARDVVVAEWRGADFSLSVNGQFFKDALSAAASEFVAISVDPTNELWPIRVDPWEPQSDRNHYGIVMPARK
jgi:DNA polymerase III sliding clamp (beta) subunit (PCNA family)